jgi:hypothetical protein
MSWPSSVPDEISFHCPHAFIGEGSKKKAVRQFSTVSGLAQHLESGACNGGKVTFRRVVEYMGRVCAGGDEGYGVWRAEIAKLEISISVGPPFVGRR